MERSQVSIERDAFPLIHITTGKKEIIMQNTLVTRHAASEEGKKGLYNML